MLAVPRATMISPWASMRSATERQLRRFTSGCGLSQCRSYSLLRLMRWMNGTSSKPAVVTYAMPAPRRWMTALVATVVPCTIRSIASTGTADFSSTSSRAPSGALGVDGLLAIRTDPSVPIATRSVKVPPVSMATVAAAGAGALLVLIRTLYDGGAAHGLRDPLRATLKHLRLDRGRHRPRRQPASPQHRQLRDRPGQRRARRRRPNRGQPRSAVRSALFLDRLDHGLDITEGE